ncbi:MAG: hypothetical protein AUK35_10480 [Zetaproteobacteria bacterium CG2_30_46_52]|nr:MAG: hypothetical protein AUK35_10480 [Zetaproteobacteria bacterium CG2_30_46_52]
MTNNHNDSNEFSDARRNLLKGAGVLGAGLLTASAIGSNAIAGEHDHHMMHGTPVGEAKNAALAKTLHACVAASELCLNHCLDMFKMGDTTMAECAISVSETMAFCTAHAKLASYDSKFLKDMCTLGIKVCADCEEKCKKHAKTQPLCKACGDSCAECITACKAYLA